MITKQSKKIEEAVVTRQMFKCYSSNVTTAITNQYHGCLTSADLQTIALTIKYLEKNIFGDE